MMGAEPSRARQGLRTVLRLGLVLLVAGLCGCRGDAPTWFELATLEAERVTFGVNQEVGLDDLEGRQARLAPMGRDLWFDVALAPNAWREAAPGAWVATVPEVLPSTMAPLEKRAEGDGLTEDLTAEGVDFRPPDVVDAARGFEAEPGRFLRVADQVQLRLEPGVTPPADTRFAWRVTHGLRGADRFHVRGRRISGDGFSVPPSTRCELRTGFPGGAILRFATTSEALLATEAPVNLRFRIRINGVSVFEHEQAAPEQGEITWHEVELPAGGSDESLVWLEVDGPPAYAAFLDPVVTPQDYGSYSARPWGARRPDLVLFLADTLRADTLGAFDLPEAPFRPSGVDLTPRLDAFAAGGRAFTNARSVSTWTLPSVSTILTGLYPHQTGLVEAGMALPAAAQTLAERLQSIGYRTAAVTEGGFVSTQHGFARGFGSFCEGSTQLDQTMAWARDMVSADDGRPLFLVVHTFETHTPYVVNEATRLRVGGALGIEADHDFDTLWAAVQEEATAERVERVRSLYLGEVADLDASFGAFEDFLTEEGLLPEGYVLFTSDHGEAFGEHGEYWHTGKPHEILVRIPLVLRGPRVRAGVETDPASLIDITPTFLDLVGLPIPAEQPGSSLLDLDDERPVYAFECGVTQAEAHFAVVEEARKIIASAEAGVVSDRVYAAYDLERDPAERNNVATEPWSGELLHDRGDDVERLIEPRFLMNEMQLDPLRRAELEALGYVDG